MQQIPYVSIPFSTIKRPKIYRNYKNAKRVSIPFSTIKRRSWTPIHTEQHKFQFHLVRLKAAQQLAEYVTSLFQFHLVRLKASEDAKGKALDNQFQFHLVRLKDSGNTKYSGMYLVSIPFSTIKRLGKSSPSSSDGVSIPFSTIKRNGIARLL